MTDYWAFDFGGVIGNSAGESGITVWRAAHALWPERVDATLGADFIERFSRPRPVINTGHENVAAVALMANGRSDEDILGAFAAQRDAKDGWLAAQNAYPGIVEAINALDAPLCITTTKAYRFTGKLVVCLGMCADADRNLRAGIL
ncbi:MAG: hypothetical protein ACI9W2_000459 [Gammaproteobacteria bacterium]|jgi:hypothetical protein